MQPDQDIDNLWRRLQRSAFRSKFKLNDKESAYLQSRGLEVVLSHAQDFIHQRLAAAVPVNDGKQTPWRGHPVFIAQHATATCCRGCLEKWHGIPRGYPLSDEQQAYIVGIIALWLERHGHPPME